MSKRKRASLGKTPAATPSGSEVEESAEDTADKEDMAHVSPDLLAGSPDIFAGKKAEAAEETEAVNEANEEPAPIQAEWSETGATMTPQEPEPPAPTESHSTATPPLTR